MAIKVNGQDLQARYINGQGIGKVMLNGQQIRPEIIPPTPDPNEYIQYTYYPKTYNNKYYIFVPISGMGHDGNYGCYYNWKVAVRKTTQAASTNYYYEGYSSQGGYIAIEVSDRATRRIKITPEPYDTYGWALAYSWDSLDQVGDFGNLTSQTYFTKLEYDESYKGYAISATHTGDYFRGRQYRGCKVDTVEVLPNTVTTIGNYFRYEQFRDAKNTYLVEEVMPSSVTSIGNGFRQGQYLNCTNLVGANYGEVEVMSNNVTSIGNNFRFQQYTNCTSLTAAAPEALSSSLTTIGNDFRKEQYWRCSSLSTSATESLPNSVTSIGIGFREEQYAQAAISTIPLWKDLSVGNSNYRANQFYGCGPTTMTVEGDVGYPTTFYSDTSEYAHWVYSLQTINVPSQYLNNYQTTTNRPRYLVSPKSIFIGY